MTDILPRTRTELIAAFKAAKSGYSDGFAISQADRDKAAASGAAMPDGSYPILSCSGENSVDTAIHAVGRGSAGHDAIRKHIITRATSLGCASKIPDSWNSDGSLKAGSAAPQFADAPVDNEPVSTVTADKPPDVEQKPNPEDDGVAKAIIALQAAYDAVVAAQAKDPDVVDPNDQAVVAKLSALKPMIDDLKDAQDADMHPPTATATNTPATNPSSPEKPTAAPPSAKPGQLALDNTTPKINPVDSDGNVDNEAICANPDVNCGHMASAHADTDDGDNTGACQMENCGCQGFVVDTGTTPTPDAGGDGGGPDNAGGDDDAPPTMEISAKATVSSFADVPDQPSASDGPEGNGVTGDDELDLEPSTPGAMNMGPEFTMVAIIEGTKTSDNRFIAPNALTWENPPWALMGKATSAHDPMGMDQDDPAVICGRVDSYERQPGPNDTQLIVGKGFFLSNDDGMYFADLLDQMGRLPVSGDVSVGITSTTLDDDGGESAMLVTLEAGMLEATTVLPFGPAFADCYIVLGPNLETPAIPQKTAEQAPLAASAQLVHWMTIENCVPCGQNDDVLVASVAPLRPPKAWFGDPGFTKGDPRLKVCIGETKYGKMVNFEACPITVTADGEVFGHIAPWGVCHIGIKGECVVAPHSKTDYTLFKRGQHVVTAEGDEVRVGVLTADVGHASEFANATVAMSHYDNTAAQVAYVNVFEDEFGIAVHGVIAASATDAQVQKLRASSPSGDWRNWGGNLELCAVLAVNEPGFVLAPKAVTAGGRQLALVAAGAQEMDALTHPTLTSEDITLPARLARKLILADARETFAELSQDALAEARARIAELAKV